MRWVCYTAITGDDRDRLYDPPLPANLCDRLFCFTDDPRRVVGTRWQAREPLQPSGDEPLRGRRLARYQKLNAHVLFPDVDASLWLDGTFTPNVDPGEFLEWALRAADIVTFKHHERVCVYQEYEACLRLRKDDPETMKAQLNRYYHERYPYFHGMACTNIVARKHTAEIAKFNETWWNELRRGSLRDQLSFNYSLWRCGLRTGYFPKGVYDFNNPWFTYRPHGGAA